MTHLLTHLASHGYIVAAADFPGDNIADLVPRDGAEAAVTKAPIDESARNRPRQASLFLDFLLAAPLPNGLSVSAGLVGTGGMSMGAFTALAINPVDRQDVPDAVGSQQKDVGGVQRLSSGRVSRFVYTCWISGTRSLDNSVDTPRSTCASSSAVTSNTW